MSILNTFGYNVRKYRKMRGYSLDEFAELTGLGKTYISAVELGKKNVGTKNIQKILDVLDISGHLLLMTEEDMLKENRKEIIKYEHFREKFEKSVKIPNKYYYDLLVNILHNVRRYVGLFRFANVNTKIKLDYMQEQERLFSDFIKEITSDYIICIGCKEIQKDVFEFNNKLYFVEKYLKDDFDSKVKMKIYDKFQERHLSIKNSFPDNEVNGILWFIDDRYVKNKKYFLDKTSDLQKQNINVKLFYGGTLFLKVFDCVDAWNELYEYLVKTRQETYNRSIDILDFDTSDIITDAINMLKLNELRLYKKLISDDMKYVQLRNELFPTRQLV